jgi:hypothetical protein
LHSLWVSGLLSEGRYELIVAHARNVRLIGENRKKGDRLDAQRLARLICTLRSQVKNRSAKAQADLTVIRCWLPPCAMREVVLQYPRSTVFLAILSTSPRILSVTFP